MDEPANEPRKPRNKLRPTSHHWLGLVIAAIAFGVYCYTLSPHPYPGESAHLLTAHSGIDPLRPLANPVYGSIVRMMAGMNVSTLAHRMAVFSALCGAACVWLVFILGYRFQYDKEISWRFKGVYLMQGGVAAFFFAFSTSIWFASSRAYPMMFDLMLLLSTVYIINMYKWTEKRWLLFAFALLFGIGAVEYTTFYLWLLPLGLYTVFYMFKKEHLTTVTMSVMVGLGLLGLCLYFVYAWKYFHLPVAEWREVPTFFRVLRHMGHEQLTSFSRSLPKIGWLTVGMVSVFPWLLTVLFSRTKSQSTDKVFALIFFLLLLTGIATAVYFNTILSPWKLIGITPLLVAPYVFTALAFGWCAAQWYSRMLPIDGHGFKKPGMPPVKSSLTVGGVAIVFIAAGAVYNHRLVDTRAVKVFTTWTDATLTNLGERKWMISTGMMDDLYLLAAHEKGQVLHLMNTANEDQAPYRAYYSSLLQHERLQSLAKIGLGALLSEWFKIEPELTTKLAVENRDSVWTTRKLLPVPHHTQFHAVANPDEIDLSAVVTDNLAFWREIQPRLAYLKAMNNPASGYAGALLMQTSRKANNLGVLCEDKKLPVEARSLYDFARVLYPDNLSALLNTLVLAQGGPDYAEIELAARAELAKEDVRLNLASMVYYHGALRSEDAIRRLRQLWDIKDVKEASEADYLKVRELYLTGKKDAALQKLERMTQSAPDDRSAWNLYALVAADVNDEPALYTCLNRMRSKGQKWPLLLEIMGNLEAERGHMDRARKHYEDALEANPMNVPLMEHMVTLDLKDRDMRSGKRHIRQLLTVDPDNAIGNLMLGMIHFMNRNYDLAENAFRNSIERSPTPNALNNLAWILHVKKEDQDALPFIKQAIEMDPTSFSSWDTLGVILYELKAYDSAHTAIDKAIELDPDKINSYIHRAQIFDKQDEREKALAVVNEIKLKFADSMQTKHIRALEYIEEE